MGQCAGIKRNGGRCTASVPPGVQWCFNHDPARAEERRRNASRAGHARPNREMATLKAQLQDVATGVLGGNVEPKRGAVAVQALSALTRAIEQERRQHELEEVLERLGDLERRYGHNGGSRSWG